MATQANRIFRAPWSAWLWVITGSSLALFLGLPLALFAAGVDRRIALLVLVATAGFLALVARMAWIRGYRVSRHALAVRRFGPEIAFDLVELDSLEVDPRAMSGTYVMPNGGLFSFGGKGCRNRRLGRYEAYATDPRRSVVLRFADRVVVVTPEDPRAFVQAVHATRETGRGAARKPRTRPSRTV